MKVFISSDMEGTAGVVDWDQCIAGGTQYRCDTDLLTREINAAIDGLDRRFRFGAVDTYFPGAHVLPGRTCTSRAHSPSGAASAKVTVNGVVAGEETAPFCPGNKTAVVQKSITRFDLGLERR